MKAKLTYRITRSSVHINGNRENLFNHNIRVLVADASVDHISLISKSLNCDPRVTDVITLWSVDKNGSLVNIFEEQINFITELFDSVWEYSSQRPFTGIQSPVGVELGFNKQLVLASGVNSSIYVFNAEYRRAV
jgi:hypothetical protein